jgi:hypothetical protein
MRAPGSTSAAGVAALLFMLLASPASAQDESRQSAPTIRVYSQSGAIASNYVTPAIEVSEDAYVFAVSLDLDGQIHILHPDYPGISVRILSHNQLRLPNFFAGFSQRGTTYDGSGRYVSNSDYNVDSENETRGTVIALASRAPFRLDRVESGGDWNIATIRGLIEHRAPASAAHALAAYLGAKGESIGTDYMRFASAQYHDYYASNPLYGCDLYYEGYSPGLALSRLAVLNRVGQMRRSGRSVSILGYDFCGMPIVAYGPSQPNTRYRPRTPRDPSDTLVTKGHVRPRRSDQSAERFPRAALGTFPLTRRGETPRAGDVLITPPRQNRRDPREIFADPRNEGRVSGLAERSRVPTERAAPPRAETGFIGTLPRREYPRPIVREAPVVHERPSSPPPPPPRTQPQTQSRPAPVFVRPPRH